MKKILMILFISFFMTGALFTKEKPDRLEKGLIGYWRMEEKSWDKGKADVKDSSTNRKHGRIFYNVQTVTNGKLGRGALFGGKKNKGYIRIQSFPTPKKITVCGWVFFKNKGDWETFSTFFTLALEYKKRTGFFIYSRDYSKEKGRSKDPKNSINILTGNGKKFVCISYSRNPWHVGWNFITTVIDNEKITLYLDGNKKKSAKLSEGLSFTGSRVEIGARGGMYYWKGVIDEVAVWNRPLSEKEIKSLYNNGKGIVLKLPK